MLTGLMLMAAASGQVIEAGPTSAVVRLSPASVGALIDVRRLEPAVGAPGRAPFFRWARTAKARVTAVLGDGTAEVALVRGQAAAGDRVVLAD